jgi:hypothetical protein
LQRVYKRLILLSDSNHEETGKRHLLWRKNDNMDPLGADVATLTEGKASTAATKKTSQVSGRGPLKAAPKKMNAKSNDKKMVSGLAGGGGNQSPEGTASSHWTPKPQEEFPFDQERGAATRLAGSYRTTRIRMPHI